MILVMAQASGYVRDIYYILLGIFTYLRCPNMVKKGLESPIQIDYRRLSVVTLYLGVSFIIIFVEPTS